MTTGRLALINCLTVTYWRRKRSRILRGYQCGITVTLLSEGMDWIAVAFNEVKYEELFNKI
jgi:hypothetical protein